MGLDDSGSGNGVMAVRHCGDAGDHRDAVERLCAGCGTLPHDNWPSELGGFLCQLCWEQEASRLWWAYMVGAWPTLEDVPEGTDLFAEYPVHYGEEGADGAVGADSRD